VKKAVELLISSYVRLKEPKALQQLLNGWQNTYDDLERRNSPRNILEGLAQEIQMIKAALSRLGHGDDQTNKAPPSAVKVLDVDISAPPQTANESLYVRTPEKGHATTVVVTGLSIAISPSPPAKRDPDA
jgi:hypothetical protein